MLTVREEISINIKNENTWNEHHFGVVKVKNQSGTDNCLLSAVGDVAELWINVDTDLENGLFITDQKVIPILITDVDELTIAYFKVSPMFGAQIYRLRY